MNRGQSLIAHPQTTKLVQPGDSAFDHQCGLLQIAAVLVSASDNLMQDATLLLQRQAVSTTVIGAISLDALVFFQRSSPFATHRRPSTSQRLQLGDVVPFGLGQNDIDQDALRIDEKVVFAALLTAIGWVWCTFSPRYTDLIHELSATARKNQFLSAARSRASSTRCSFLHIPAFCQARSRRQLLVSMPHSIFYGSISYGIPRLKN